MRRLTGDGEGDDDDDGVFLEEAYKDCPDRGRPGDEARLEGDIVVAFLLTSR
jgi:hypothetical protein